MINIKSMIARIINAASAVNKTAPTAGIDAIISPTVNAKRIDTINMITSSQHLFFLSLP